MMHKGSAMYLSFVLATALMSLERGAWGEAPVALQTPASAGKPAQAASKPVAAEARLAEAWKVAKAWQADAELTRIGSTGHVLGDGRAMYEVFASEPWTSPESALPPTGKTLPLVAPSPGTTLPPRGIARVNSIIRPEPWAYFFYSKAAGKGYEILFGPRGATPSEVTSVSPEFQQALPKEFVDSDRAMAEAVRNGFHPNGRHRNHMWAGTCYGGHDYGFFESIWLVYDRDEPKEGMYIISAGSGRFVRKTGFILNCEF